MVCVLVLVTGLDKLLRRPAPFFDPFVWTSK